MHERIDSTRPGTSLPHLQQEKALSYFTVSRSQQADRTTPRKSGYEFESSPKGEYQDKSYPTGQDGTNPIVNIIPLHSLSVGQPDIGLRSIKQ